MGSEAVLVVGSTNQDLVFRSDRLPRPGETILGQDLILHPGGKGANQAVAVARLGGASILVSNVGNDPFGNALMSGLRQAGVVTSEVQVLEDSTSGAACILVDDAGMNSIVVAPGANARVSALQVFRAMKRHSPAIVLAQLEIPLEAVEAASKAEFFILNPAPARPLPSNLLRACTILTPNEIEIETLTGIFPHTPSDCERASSLLLDQGVTHVVTTLGARGCYWYSASGGFHIEAPSVATIDTTAAGDAFNGSLALFLAEGREMATALRLANCVGALSTTKQGAQASMPDRDALHQLAGDLL